MPKICYVPKRFSPGVRAVIDQAVTFCDEWVAMGYDLTLRQLYYRFVAAGLLANKQSEYNRLGEIINDARLAGLLDWDHITDRTRNLRALSHWGTPADIIASAASSYRRDKWHGQPVCAEVWVEKEALVGIVGAACEPEDVPYFACKGYTSQSEMWGAAQRLRWRIARKQATTIFHLGDHDPSGMDMSRDIEQRLYLFLSTHGYHSGFRLQRIALNLDQIDQYRPPPNPAKALALDTPIPTPTGWTTMGAIQTGDTIFGQDGQPCTVTAKSDVLTGTPCYALRFSGGAQIVASGDHLWRVDARKRAATLLTTEQIARTWHEGTIQRPVYRIPVAGALNLPDADLPIPPYVLGAWLGDGLTCGEGMFACSEQDHEILEHVASEGYRVARHSQIRCQIYGLRGQLHALGLAGHKHIPAAYLRASHQQRLALLQGLMDTDGTVMQNREMRPCSYCTMLQPLATQVIELLATLGIRSRMSHTAAMLNGHNYGQSSRVEFYPGDIPVCRLARKRERLAGSTVAVRQTWRTIIDVQPVESIPTQCIAVDSPQHLYLATEHFIATHNTTDARFTKYQEEYGDESWELDALPPDVLTTLITEAITSVRDADRWDEEVDSENEERADIAHAAKHWAIVTDHLSTLDREEDDGD